ncbi:lovastatin nonaketide synthase [Nannizzia gypsea CBS 118893]|uniref:Non-reducing polyketide synthase nscA n=1 Tax=Arthroderma gypseum (strain ATCC MYA-4604 / CBS 118893) TaxID=535722 RepID=E4UU00_ARTGP|nr:lovastatin nonaketide synthase [Nannizzia gypsea CBS 118893]EFR00806.1 lovastatin nonaketide synthase [Nannizzia gypsea CBS 118893]
MDCSDKQEPIAIVGAACRFAGEVSSLGSLWDMISKVKTGHCTVPGDRWNSSHWYHPDPDRKGSIGSQHGYFLQQDISHFDAPFFSITAKEAAAMDPMKRLLLEVSYESFENAGIPVEDLMNSRTGCYVGSMRNDYEMISTRDFYDISHPAATGLSGAMTANRVSWFFGLKGPSMTLDTACSSSLYALHLACQSLRLRETNMSLIAGVNLMINPNTMNQLTAMHMLSPEGISHTFDDRANGYGRGDGIGALIVKRLSDAIRDGDTIRAVIRGTGVNADGKTPSITQPSSEAQADLINQTYTDAGLDQSETEYFECHGTGTPVGDPLELNAIASTLGAARRTAGKSPLYIGSIKPTVGHTEGCAGLAGVFKAILLLEKGMLVPTYGVEQVNPKLKLTEWNLALPQDIVTWPSAGLRRVSVNSFGFGGANAHIILEDAYHYLQERGLAGRHNTTIHDSGSDSGVDDAPVNGAVHDESKQLFLFSSKDQAGTKRVSEGINTWLQSDSTDKSCPYFLENLAYTLALRRTHLEHRTFAVASSLSELTKKISQGLPAATRAQRHGDNLVMVFTGQGAQWAAMGRGLFENPIFRQSIDDSQSHLQALGCKWNANEELTKIPNPNIDRPEYSQPLCTVVQVALVDLLRSWKILPTATIGHSSGEIAAAYAASFLTQSDAIKLAYVRGLSSAAISKQGAMMAAGLSEDDAQIYLEKVPQGSAVVACVNSPSSVTLSGDVDAINQLEALISSDGKFARKLKVATAYHSPHMREVSPSYLEMIGELSPRQRDESDSSSPVMYSSLTGSMVSSAEELSAQYWVDNMQNPVRFSQGFLALLKHKRVASGSTRPVAIHWGGFLEVGPHAALKGPLRQIIDASNNKFAKSAPYASMLVRGKDARETSLDATGVLWAAGCKIDMGAVTQHPTVNTTPQMLCDLPSYPWNHTRGFWHESYTSRSHRFPSHERSDFLGIPEDSPNSHEPRWRNYLRISENPWIEDHTITGTVLYPGAGMLVMALEGVLRTADSSKTVDGFRFNDVMFERGLVVSLDDGLPVETRISFHPHGIKPDSWTFTVFSMTKGSPWAKHCSGTVALVYEKDESEVEEGRVDPFWQKQLDLRKALLSTADSMVINVDEFYKNLDSIGMQYGPVFRNVVSLTLVPSMGASHGSIAVPDTRSTMPKHYEPPHVIHPATMDSIFHIMLASLNNGQPVKQAAVPYSIEEMYIARDQPQEPGALYSGYGRLLSQSGHEIAAELSVSDQEWEKPKLSIKNFALRQVTSGDDREMAGSILPGTTKNCARITWIPDLAFVTRDEDHTKLVSSRETAALINSLLDPLFLKMSSNTVLVVMFDESKSSTDLLLDLKNRTYGPKKIIALATSESGGQLMRATLGESTEKTTIIYNEWLPENELLQTLAPEANDLVIGLGVPDVSKNATTLMKLAPLACLTHASQPDEVDIVIPASKLVSHFVGDTTGVLFASSTSSPSAVLPDSVILLLPISPSDTLRTFATTIQAKLENCSVSVSQKILTPCDVASLSGQSVISLLEVDNPLVYAWDEDQFHAFKALVSTVERLFWITHGSVLESWSNGIEFATSQGLLRVLRNEYPVTSLPSLDLSAAADISSGLYVDLILNVWRASLAEDAEMEYAESNGLIYIPRAIEDAGFDYELQLASNTAKPVMSALGASGKPLKASDSLNTQGCIWVPDKEAESSLQADEIEVKVEYAGLGTSKTLSSAHHAVGIVTRRADSAKAFELGQRVIVFSHSAARTHVRQAQSLVAPLPEGLGPQEAVALVEPMITAQYALIEIAHLKRGQALLLDNAASAVGQSLIRAAKAVGANIFALVRSKAERGMISDVFGIPTDHIFDSALDSFVPFIQSITYNCGVDVVVNQQSGAHISRAMSVLSDFGQFVDINGGSTKALLPTSKANFTFTRIDMATLMQSRPSIISKLFQRAFNEYTFQERSPLTVLPVTNLSASTNNTSAEQVVVSLTDASSVPMHATYQELKLDSQATYVLAGGLGALGLDIANWMVECGAKNLVFLSRSGGSKNEDDLQKFAERSVRAEAYKCNVNDAVSVAQLFDSLKASGRRIAGVIQLAMVLEDGIFENMSFAQWRRAIEPKTKGSRNLLANIWPGDKPFFILLSSITGVIGNTAQANYASGNTFEDALAHHARAHLGINATSIDVGLVSDSSHFTAAGEFGDLSSYLSRYQHGWRGLQTNLKELGVVMQAIMRRSTTLGQSAPAQIVLGLGDRIEHNESAGGFSKDKKFELRVVKTGNDASDGKATQDVGVLLSNATSMAEAAVVVEDNIKELVAAAMGVPPEEIDSQKPLYDYGVDSLQAVEVRNRALKNMRGDISVFDILSAMPLAGVAAKIAASSQWVNITADED